MKIKLKRYDMPEIQSVSDFVANSLNGADYDRGRLEEAQATADNCREALGRLCELLADKKILDAADIIRVVGGYCTGERNLRRTSR